MAKGTIEKSDFGKTKDGAAVEAYTLTNSKGMKAKLITYGATLTELHIPDKDGKMADVVLWDRYPFSVYARAERVWIDGELMFDRVAGKWPLSDFEVGVFDVRDVKKGGAK